MRKLILVFWAVLFLNCCIPLAFAAEAEEISGKGLVSGYSGFGSLNRLFDGRTMEATKIKDKGSITLAHEKGIGALYLVFGQEYGGVSVTNEETGETHRMGEAGFLHEFLNVEEVFGYAPKQIRLTFDRGEVQLNELSVFTPGEVPEWVQRWSPPAEGEADLVLFSAHGDDEQLFFAGILPYYGQELGYNVQVVYLTGHRNMTMRRSHEMLDGLWAVGVRHYPVFGPFGDYNTRSLTDAYQKYSYKGISREDILSFVVENVRRFRPKVAVGHDLKGEYGHGMHMVYAELLCEAAEVSADASRFPDSCEKYGIWEIPKTYLHLYPENEIVMDWDAPLESFGGMTAFEVTRDRGFPCHASQQSYYSWYFEGVDSASEIAQYSPCEFGLYRSTVGEDREKNDFFENVTSHAEDVLQEAKRQAEEAAKKQLEEAAKETAPAETAPCEVTMQPDIPEAGEDISVFPAAFAGIPAVFLIIFSLNVYKKKK